MGNHVQELEAHYQMHLPVLRRLVRPYIRQPGDGREILQKVWVNAQKWVEEHGPPRTWIPWLNRVTIHAAIDHRRYHTRRLKMNRPAPFDEGFDMPDHSLGPAETMYRHQLRHHLDAALEQLARKAPQEAVAIYCIHVMGMTSVEAGRELGIPAGTVRSRVLRGIRKLRLSLRAKAA